MQVNWDISMRMIMKFFAIAVKRDALKLKFPVLLFIENSWIV